MFPPEDAELLIEGVVIGTPATAGSKTAFTNPKTGKIIVKDSSDTKGTTWRQDVQASVAHLVKGELLDCPLALEFRVVRARRKAHYGTGRNAGVLKDSAPLVPAVRPDLTKQLRAFEDALAGVFIREDSRIVSTLMEKVYGEAPERAEFRLWRLPATVGDATGSQPRYPLPEQTSLIEGAEPHEDADNGNRPRADDRVPAFPGL